MGNGFELKVILFTVFIFGYKLINNLYLSMAVFK